MIENLHPNRLEGFDIEAILNVKNFIPTAADL
jgi:hypothetical protein